VAEGLLCRLGVFTGESHDLDDLLRGEGGRGAGAGLIGEDRREEPEPLAVRGAFGLGGFQTGRCLGPTLTPQADRLAMEVELTSDLIVGKAGGGKADDLETTEQLLGSVLTSCQVVEQLSLALGKLDGKRARGGHQIGSCYRQRSGRVRLSRPKYIPFSPWRRTSAVMY
jgi:hypothetical protein